MRFGALILPDRRWSDGGARWRRAEELGFDHAWTYDHLAWRTLRDSPWFAAIPTLIAAATVTRTIRLGPLVASPSFRHPVPFAKELMTLDDLSDGRLTVGIGAGGSGWDASMLGHPPWSPAERAGRFDEFVELTDMILRQDATSFRGEYYAADGARSVPGCVQRPRAPFAIAATGRRGMLLAANYGDLWVTTGDRNREPGLAPPEGAAVVREQIRRLEIACETAGRDPASIGRMVVTGPLLDPCLHDVEAFREAIGCYEEAGVTDLVVHWPRTSGVFSGALDTFEEVFSSR